MQKLFAPDRMFDKDGAEIEDKSSVEYLKKFNETRIKG